MGGFNGLIDYLRKKRLYGNGGDEDYETDYEEPNTIVRSQTTEDDDEDMISALRGRTNPALDEYQAMVKKGSEYKKPSFGKRLLSAITPIYDVDKNPDNPKSEEFRERVNLLAKSAELEGIENKGQLDLAGKIEADRDRRLRMRELQNEHELRESDRQRQEANRVADNTRADKQFTASQEAAERAEQDRLLAREAAESRFNRSQAGVAGRFRESQAGINKRFEATEASKGAKGPTLAVQAQAEKQVLDEIRRNPKLRGFAQFFDAKGKMKDVDDLAEDFAVDKSLVKQYDNLRRLVETLKKKKAAGGSTQDLRSPDNSMPEIAPIEDNSFNEEPDTSGGRP